METFLLAFIPLFVALDPMGVLPLFVSLTQRHSLEEKRRLAFQAVMTAFFVGLAFGLGGHWIFRALGISTADFRVAGGLLLLIFSVREIFGTTDKLASGRTKDDLVGIVPLGIPLIAGPATLTTLLILHDEYSQVIIMAAFATNLLIVWYLCAFSDRIVKAMGEAMTKVIAKVVAIFLAAIGVMMVRRGLESILSGIN